LGKAKATLEMKIVGVIAGEQQAVLVHSCACASKAARINKFP